MGVLKELKELVKEMGGNAANARTASQAIDKIPASGGSGVFTCTSTSQITDDEIIVTLNKTAGELLNAMKNGPVFICNSATNPGTAEVASAMLISTGQFNNATGAYTFMAGEASSQTTFTAHSPTEYPSFTTVK